MPPEETELTFIRCPSCRSLVPAVATRCRMCGQLIEQAASNEPSSGNSSGSSSNSASSASLDALNRKSRVRQRTTSVSESERETARETASETLVDSGADFETRIPSEPPTPRVAEITRDASPQGSESPFRLGRGRNSESAPVENTAPSPSQPTSSPSAPQQTAAPADNWLRNMNSELEPHSDSPGDSSRSDDDGEYDESDEFDDDGEEESEVISFRGLKSDGESGAPRGDNSNFGVDQEQLGDRKRRRRRRKRRRGGERGDQPDTQRSEQRQEPRQEQRQDTRQEARQESWQETPAREERAPQQRTRQQERAPETEHIDTHQEVEGQLIGWFVNFASDPRGSATEIRSGRFFISGEQLRPSDMVFRHESVSTPHCLVRASSSQGIQLQDLMSERGTYVRKRGEGEFRRFQEMMSLEAGDVVRFGECEVTICLIPYGRKR